MKVSAYLPSKALSPFVKRYVIVEVDRERVNRILPDTSVALAFRFKGHTSYHTGSNLINLPNSVVTGLRKEARLLSYSGNAASLIVSFKEMGAAGFFKAPLHKFFGESISLAAFIEPRKIALVEEQLVEADSNALRVRVIENFLLSQLSPYHQDKLVARALDKIGQAKGIIKISELAEDLCISQDAFEKRFRKVTGTTAKQFSSLVRLKLIVSQAAHHSSFTSLALNAGYYDSAHFNKDFKLFTGQSPKEFFKAPVFW